VRTAIRKHLGDFVAVLVLVFVSAGVAAFILSHQRFRFPLIQAAPKRLNAEFSTAQAVVAGQGQTVRVSGVQVGDIAGVKLENGRAVIQMDISDKYRDLVRTNATALLRPKTGLKDMFIDLDPGHAPAPVAKKGWTLPIQNTQPDVNPDEILGALDADTRDYLKLLINGAGQGLKGRGAELRDVFSRFEPTHRDLARVSAAVATRRENLRRLIHSLHVLSAELASKGPELAQLVDSSSAVFRAFASEDQNISRTVSLLPGALRQTTDTLAKVQRFADVLGPTAQKLRPAFRKLDDANRAVRPFAREAAPILRRQIRPFVRASRPLVRDLRPAAAQLAAATPDLTRSFVVLNHLFNLLGFNPNGREGPDVSNQVREEGYLFWIAWAAHDSTSVFATADAHNTLRSLSAGGTCNTIRALANQNSGANEFIMGLTGLLTNPALCG
jgi:phospholipid/cholesterol/gamma-HCH transport system substrate-binding protein